MSQAIRLSVKFFTDVKGFKKNAQGKVEAPDTYKKQIMKNIESVLAGGMEPAELERLMDVYITKTPSHEQTYDIDEILKALGVRATKGAVKHNPDNLMEHGKFYYHPALQIAPPPPTVEILPDGTFRSSYEESTEFYLEMRESFTLDDLVDYFYKKSRGDSRFREKHKGAFRHMLKHWTLDEVLYGIDEAVMVSLDLNKDPITSPFDIDEYYEEACAMLEERKNTLYTGGLDHVIPRS